MHWEFGLHEFHDFPHFSDHILHVSLFSIYCGKCHFTRSNVTVRVHHSCHFCLPCESSTVKLMSLFREFARYSLTPTSFFFLVTTHRILPSVFRFSPDLFLLSFNDDCILLDFLCFYSLRTNSCGLCWSSFTTKTARNWTIGGCSRWNNVISLQAFHNTAHNMIDAALERYCTVQTCFIRVCFVLKTQKVLSFRCKPSCTPLLPV